MLKGILIGSIFVEKKTFSVVKFSVVKYSVVKYSVVKFFVV